ncbi:Hypothetical protein, putative [Bodo saltans]|uniref:Uncharacterized protein n=1 Tax=Bodo saltans TaxID=75058 RepID=A0A0S4JDW5_BODSA|nr:Hypothetical protein, putative [Bodo saltans]|eukprot:CUG87181.1 Hypothetical protein, putative [Bodo saltans]
MQPSSPSGSTTVMEGTSQPTQPSAAGPVIVRVTFFVTNPSVSPSSSLTSTESHRTQLWLSLVLDPTTSPRDVIVHAFRHAIQRLGGAKMDAHPTRMLIFLQSHGEFIKLDDHKKPLLSYDPIIELVQREGKKSITTALLSDVEYRRYNKDMEIADIAEKSTQDPSLLASPTGHKDPMESSLELQNRLSPTSMGSNSGSFQFRGRNRAGSILPEALAHDPLADQRITRNKTRNSNLSPPNQSLANKLDMPVTEDSFMLPPSAAAQLMLDHRQKGSCVVFFVTPTGRKLKVTVEYPLGALGGEVIDRAIELLHTEAAAHKCEWELSSAFLDMPEALTLLYQRADDIHRRFGREDVLPISRGNRSEGPVQLFLCVDRSKMVTSNGSSPLARGAAPAWKSASPTKAAASPLGSSVLSQHRRRSNSVANIGRPSFPTMGASGNGGPPVTSGAETNTAASRSDVLRVVGGCSALTSFVENDEGKLLLPYSEIPTSQLERFFTFKAQDILYGVPEVCQKGSVLNQDQQDEEVQEVVCSLLHEETSGRLDLAKQQVRIKSVRKDIDELTTAHSEMVAEEEALSEQCMALQKVIGEAKGAERDIARIQDLMEWFTKDIDAAKERHRELTRQLFSLDRT